MSIHKCQYTQLRPLLSSPTRSPTPVYTAAASAVFHVRAVNSVVISSNWACWMNVLWSVESRWKTQSAAGTSGLINRPVWSSSKSTARTRANRNFGRCRMCALNGFVLAVQSTDRRVETRVNSGRRYLKFVDHYDQKPGIPIIFTHVRYRIALA